MLGLAALTLAAACGPRVVPVGDDGESDGNPTTSTSGIPTTSGSTSTDSGSTETSGDTDEETGPVDCAPNQTECPDGSCSPGGRGFIPEPWPCCDHGGECNPNCSAREQDCPEGDKCTAFSGQEGYCIWNDSKCRPVIGDRGLGETCTREGDNDDCARGLLCVTSKDCPTESGPGRCVAFCGPQNDPPECVSDWASQPSAVCETYAEDISPRCYEPCDPDQPDCPEGFSCWGNGQNGPLCQPG